MWGDDGGYVRFRAPHLGSGLSRKDGGGGLRRSAEIRRRGTGMTGVAWGSTPRTWVPACGGKMEEVGCGVRWEGGLRGLG